MQCCKPLWLNRLEVHQRDNVSCAGLPTNCDRLMNLLEYHTLSKSLAGLGRRCFWGLEYRSLWFEASRKRSVTPWTKDSSNHPPRIFWFQPSPRTHLIAFIHKDFYRDRVEPVSAFPCFVRFPGVMIFFFSQTLHRDPVIRTITWSGQFSSSPSCLRHSLPKVEVWNNLTRPYNPITTLKKPSFACITRGDDQA